MTKVIGNNIWWSYKHLYSVLQSTLANPTGPTSPLEHCLQECKPLFTNLLRNPSKNDPAHKGISMVHGEPGEKKLIPGDLANEAIILSDLFDMNELSAIELLGIAEKQMVHHPGLKRGMVAILLYYDSRKAMSCALRDIFQAVDGVTWSVALPRELSIMLTRFVLDLVENSMILEQLIELLSQMDLDKEILILSKNRAFGSRKHKHQVVTLYESTRKALAMTLFNYSAQRGLPIAVAIRLMQNLAAIKSSDATGNIDDLPLIMLMALLFSFNTSVLRSLDQDEAFLPKCSNIRLPILNDPQFTKHLYDAIEAQTNWQSPNLSGIIKLSFGVALTSFRHVSPSIQSIIGTTINRGNQLVDEALSVNIFQMLHRQILEKDLVYSTEYIYRGLHNLIIDFIDYMNAKLKEIRDRVEETEDIIHVCQREGSEVPSNLDNNYEQLLLCVAKLHGDPRVVFKLCDDFFGLINSSNQPHYFSYLYKLVPLDKFVPKTILKSYWQMINGITGTKCAAHYVFTDFKDLSTNPTSMSWQIFFLTLTNYYDYLRNDNKKDLENCDLRELDNVQGLVGVMRKIAELDESSRLQLCDDSMWHAAPLLLCLVTCAIPLSLKAEILFTVAALAKSKEIAITIWQNLEDSQIIPTSEVRSKQCCSIVEEIEQNENSIKIYKMTCGILELIYTLLASHMPSQLNTKPYISFILDTVLLKLNVREYRDPAEKWEVGSKCLKIAHYVLATYKPQADDFLEKREPPSYPHPGFQIMLQLQNKSQLLSLLLNIIEETRWRLDEYEDKFRGKAEMEECAKYALMLLEVGLLKQSAFFEARSASNHFPAMCSGLNRMLLDVSPTSRKSDYLLTILKFVSYNSWLPRHALSAIRILTEVIELPNVSAQILASFGVDSMEKQEIRQGFVECIETSSSPSYFTTNEDEEEAVSGDKVDSELTTPSIEEAIKLAIVKFLQLGLKQPMPSFGHYLLGVDLLRDFMVKEKVRLIIETGGSCISALVLLIERYAERQSRCDLSCEREAQEIERFCHLLLDLCADNRLSEAMLRFLRISCNDFLMRHLASMPFQSHTNEYIQHAMSHLMSCIAIEIRMAAVNERTTRIRLLCNILLVRKGGRSHSEAGVVQQESGLQVSCLLESIDLNVEPLEKPNLLFFDSATIHQLLQECESPTILTPNNTSRLINVRKLNDVLHYDLCLVRNTISSAQRPAINDEITALLNYAIQLNAQRMRICATINFVDSWCQLVQMIFINMSKEVMPFNQRKQIIMEILETTLFKIEPCQPIALVSVHITETVMILLGELHHCLIYSEEHNTGAEPGAGKSSDQPYSINMDYILKRLFDWIMYSEVNSKKMRVHLYVALLHCLRIEKGKIPNQETYAKQLDPKPGYVEKRLLGDHLTIREVEKNGPAQVNTSYGEKLIKKICEDGISGPNVCRMAALGCLDLIAESRIFHSLSEFVTMHGYVKYLLTSIANSDDELCKALQPTPETMHTLYVYESQMAFLMRISHTLSGAGLLLGEGALGVLAKMSVYDQQATVGSDERFRLILLPTLSLCNEILNSLGTENDSAVLQIINFLLAHKGMIESMLRTATPLMDIERYQLVSSVTHLLARTVKILGDEHNKKQLRNQLHGIQQLMIRLFSRFTVSEATIKDMLQKANERRKLSETEKDRYVNCFLDITANLTLFCRNITTCSADNSTEYLITTIVDDMTLLTGNANEKDLTSIMRTFLEQLKGAVTHYVSQKSTIDNLLQQRSTLASISFEFKEKGADIELREWYREKSDELLQCIFIAEQNLYLLWIHLDFHLRNTIIYKQNHRNDLGHSKLPVLSDSHKDLAKLKQMIISTLDETFCQHFITASKSYAVECKDFVAILLQRIKQLVTD